LNEENSTKIVVPDIFTNLRVSISQRLGLMGPKPSLKGLIQLYGFPIEEEPSFHVVALREEPDSMGSF
jgi:hypothetical protein